MNSNFLSISISYFNINSISNKKIVLENHLIDNKFKFKLLNNIDIQLLSETFLKDKSKININNYAIVRNDKLNGRGGGTAILIKKCYSFEILDLKSLSPFENLTAIKIRTADSSLVIISCYINNDAKINPNDFNYLFRLGDKVLLASDMNCKNTYWNCKSNCSKGKALKNYLDNLNYIDYIDYINYIDLNYIFQMSQLSYQLIIVKIPVLLIWPFQKI
jgi:hypothetical protein